MGISIGMRRGRKLETKYRGKSARSNAKSCSTGERANTVAQICLYIYIAISGGTVLCFRTRGTVGRPVGQP